MTDEHFDKKLLALLILVFLAVAVGSPTTTGTFAIHCIDTLNGALLGIITGKYMALRSNTPTGANPPQS